MKYKFKIFYKDEVIKEGTILGDVSDEVGLEYEVKCDVKVEVEESNETKR